MKKVEGVVACFRFHLNLVFIAKHSMPVSSSCYNSVFVLFFFHLEVFGGFFYFIMYCHCSESDCDGE